MQNVPKIVRDRLKATAPAVNHPDADVLTAFAERSLSDPERAVVLEHLARCGDCRDIVAFSLPATEPVQSASGQASGGWLSWPTLRWGFVAAGVVAIASLGVVQYRHRLQLTMTAYKAPAPTTNEAKNDAPPASAVPAGAASERNAPATSGAAFADYADRSKVLLAEPKRLARSNTPGVPAPEGQLRRDTSGSFAARSFPHGPKVANQWQQNNANAFQLQAPAPPIPASVAKQQAAGNLASNKSVPAPSEMVEVQAQAGAVNAREQNLDVRQLENQPTVQPSLTEEETRVGKAKPITPQAVGGPIPASASPTSPAQIHGALQPSSTLNPRWAITAAGVLQRSFDQGSTWQDVDVNASPAFDRLETFAVAKSSRKQMAEVDKKDQKKEAALTFRAVAASGPDVWAGGSGGALYHSVDAGTHWTRILPFSSGIVLTGDIISLESPDAQRCKVTTSTSEVWITTDDGQTWQKQ